MGRSENEKEKAPRYSRSRSRSYSRSESFKRKRASASPKRGTSYEKKYNGSTAYRNERRSSRSPRMRYRKKTSRDNSAENQGKS